MKVGYNKHFANNFDFIDFGIDNKKRIYPCAFIKEPKPLKMNIIECRKGCGVWIVFIHIWYKAIKYNIYETKQNAVNAATKIKTDYLPNFEIIVEESFF